MTNTKDFRGNHYKKSIREFYDHSYLTYKLFAYNFKSLSIHYGFWDSHTKNIQQAMLNEIQTVIDQGNIQKNQRILDAGCGVGGGAIYIAKNRRAFVTGISLSPIQISSAIANARVSGVEDLTKFAVQDYTNTHFPNNYFEVVYGIESICYAYPKSTFLQEAYRILKPGGKLIISDGYLKRKPRSISEENIYNLFRYGMATPPMITAKQMSRAIASFGFRNVVVIQKIDKVAPSVRYFYNIGLVLCLITAPIRFFHPVIQAIYVNAIGAIYAYKALQVGLADYAVHVATKDN